MSTLTVTNIKATGETASRAVSGVAAAWVNFNGTGTIAARDSLNVASLTDVGTGNHTINLTNNFSDANYNASAVSGTGTSLRNISQANTQASSSFSIYTGANNTTAPSDAEYNYLTLYGDLA